MTDHHVQETILLMKNSINSIMEKSKNILKNDHKNVRIIESRFNLLNSIINEVRLHTDSLISKKIHVILKYSECINMSVVADKCKVEKVIGNILHNAIKKSFKKSTIIINIQNYQISDARADHNILDMTIIVSDEGIGMSNLLISSIVSKSDISGHGIFLDDQLMDVKYIVKSLGGTIKIEIKVGVGTSFSVTFPLEVIDPNDSSYIPDIEITRELSIESDDSRWSNVEIRKNFLTVEKISVRSNDSISQKLNAWFRIFRNRITPGKLPI